MFVPVDPKEKKKIKGIHLLSKDKEKLHDEITQNTKSKTQEVDLSDFVLTEEDFEKLENEYS